MVKLIFDGCEFTQVLSMSGPSADAVEETDLSGNKARHVESLPELGQIEIEVGSVDGAKRIMDLVAVKKTSKMLVLIDEDRISCDARVVAYQERKRSYFWWIVDKWKKRPFIRERLILVFQIEGAVTFA